METVELEKAINCEDLSQLNRNRSFKSKQLVRSQAIRESQSPPRTHSPAQRGATGSLAQQPAERPASAAGDGGGSPSHCSELSSDAISSSDVKVGDGDDYEKKQQVEIQITSGAWEPEARGERCAEGAEPARDLLSYSPRVYCVCGACANCPHCRGRRRKRQCPTKQDSGIACSDDCPDCSDSEQAENASTNDLRKSGSFDVEDQSYYCRCPERKERPKNISLCKNESDERFEPTGPELVAFIKETLNKNARDRFALFKIEKELNALVNDTGRCVVKFPVMTSYGRMLVHRCASLFQLSHHLDQMNKAAVLVSKNGTSGGRIPCTSFKEWCVASFPPSPQRHQSDGHKFILKRDTHSLDETGSGVLSSNRSKSLEQREKEYERVRRRIFSTDNCSQQDEQWPWLNSGPVKLLTSDAGRNKLLKVQSLESSGSGAASGSGSGSNTNWRARGAVSKSHSFGGYAQPHANNHSPAQPQQHRLLSRQGDLASSSWRLSPSSSGYKTLSLRSTDSITPSPTGGASPEPSACGGGAGREAVVWCVTDMAAVPPGALVIHPQTGRPLTNPDGSFYHFDPSNPPVIYDPSASDDEQQKKGQGVDADAGAERRDPVDPPAQYDSAAPRTDPHYIDQSNEKKRGRLEKQHSFSDNDCECQPSAESRSKCCCDCRRDDGTQKKTTSEKETNTKSPSPNNLYEANAQTSRTQNVPTSLTQNVPTSFTQNAPTGHAQNVPTGHAQNVPTGHVQDVPTSHPQETTNNSPPYDPSTNHKPPAEITQRQYETPANQRQVYDNQNTNQKVEPQNSFETTNHRHGNDIMVNNTTKLANQDSQELQQYPQAYAHAYRTDEVASPPQMNHYVQADGSVQAVVPQAKVAPMPMQDSNIRSVSMTNMVYPAAIPPGYPYQCRIDQQLQPVYQTLVQTPDEQKQLAPSPHAPDTTFRIDPSYPYAAIDYTAAACGACVDTASLQHQQRSYSVPYGQVEMPPAVLPPYQVGSVLVPQHHVQQYPYQEPVPWPAVGAKLMVPEVYPQFVQYPQPHYPHYNFVYPQVIPQPYPICQPMYPIIEKQPEPQRRNSAAGLRPAAAKRNSISGSAGNTPSQEDKVPYDEKNTDIAVKIQQIKSQMAQLNTRDRDRPRREDWRRGEANGNGLLGSYPVNNYQGRPGGRTSNDESQLSSAARAIVNSIRNMQAKNTYQDTRRAERYDGPKERPERRRPEREDERPERPPFPQDVRRAANLPLYRQPYLFRQMSPGTWYRRSPGAVHPVLNHPRRPHPDNRNGRR